jgi:hypothetical protein
MSLMRVAVAAADRRRYRSEVLADKPLAYWRMADASGTTMADELGANHGAYLNSPTLGAAGAVAGNAAVTLNGVIQGATAPNLSLGNVWTLECWATRTAYASHTLLCSGINGSGNIAFFMGFGITVVQPQTLQIGFRNSVTGPSGNNFFTTVSIGGRSTHSNWVHYVATWDGTNLYAYADAALLGGGLRTGTVPTTTTTSYIGKDYAGGGGYGGGVDEVAIYPTALSADRILAHYNARNNP